MITIHLLEIIKHFPVSNNKINMINIQKTVYVAFYVPTRVTRCMPVSCHSRVCGKSQTFISYKDTLKIMYKITSLSILRVRKINSTVSTHDSNIEYKIKIDVYLTSSLNANLFFADPRLQTLPLEYKMNYFQWAY